MAKDKDKPTDIAEVIRETSEPVPTDEQTAALLDMLKQSQVNASEPIEADEFLFLWRAVAFMPRQNIVSLKAPAKSGKTFALTAFALAFLNGDFCGLKGLAQADESVLYIDTEQARNDTRKVLRRINSQTTRQGSDIDVLNVKNIKAADRLALIDLQVKAKRPALIIVDGIADLIPGMDYNDQKAADEVITTLSQMAEDNNAVVICAIHTNNKDDFATGWLGRLLRQKCAVELSLKRSGNDSARVLEASAVRHREIEPMAIEIEDTPDGLGHARIVPPDEVEQAAKDKRRQHHREVLRDLGITPPLTIKRTDLLQKIMAVKCCPKNTANNIITRALKAGALRQDGERIIFDEC